MVIKVALTPNEFTMGHAAFKVQLAMEAGDGDTSPSRKLQALHNLFSH